jgi:DNA-binding NarL/FixJ family response regulator
VLLLANRLQPDLMLSALSMGASGFLLKSLSSKDLVDAIAHLASGGSLVSPKAVGSLLDTIRAPKTSSPIEVLTKLERDVLSALTSGATNRQIGRSLHLSEKTVKNYVSSILNKLGLRNRVEAAVLMTQLSARKFSEEPR